MGEPCAIGRLEPDGPWVGFVRDGDGYRLAVGADETPLTADADADLRLVLAIVYFENALDDPPPDLEATHADVSGLVRSVAASAVEADTRRLLSEAVDAIDDGLAEDEVIARLAAARAAMGRRGAVPRAAGEQADPIGLLRDRVAALGAGH
jgi:hypothetical protein